MFERFDDGARRAVVTAQEEAGRLGSAALSTEHLLLGLLDQPDGAATAVLGGLGVPLDAIRARLEQAVGREGSRSAGHLPLDPGAKKALGRALREALDLGDNYVGTQHLLLGVLAERHGPGAGILRDLGVEPALVAERVRQLPREAARLEPGAVRPPADAAAMRRMHRIETGLRRLSARLGAVLTRLRRRRR